MQCMWQELVHESPEKRPEVYLGPLQLETPAEASLKKAQRMREQLVQRLNRCHVMLDAVTCMAGKIFCRALVAQMV